MSLLAPLTIKLLRQVTTFHSLTSPRQHFLPTYIVYLSTPERTPRFMIQNIYSIFAKILHLPVPASVQVVGLYLSAVQYSASLSLQ